MPSIAEMFRNILVLVLVVFFFACKNNDVDYHKPEDALDAGREFIQLSLQGKFETAKKYMLQDKDNLFWFNKFTDSFNKYSEQEKASFGKASINIAEIDNLVADSVTIISFSNSYKKVPQKLKVINYRGDWVVDFKYTFTNE